MMLADHLIQGSGTDYEGVGFRDMIKSIASRVREAQRFVMGRDAAEACLELLRSRPSNMIKGLPLCRLPYKTMWIETAGGFADVAPRPGAPIPAMQGTLIEGFDDQRGVMTVAWVHAPTDRYPDHHCNASPYSLYFDFAADADAAALAREHHRKILASGGRNDLIEAVIKRIDNHFSLPRTDEGIREFMLKRSYWDRWADDPREVEALHQHDRHMQVGLSPHGLGGLTTAMDHATMLKDPKFFVAMMQSWETDIIGEGPFAQLIQRE